MTKAPDIEAIEARKQEIDEQIAALQKEAGELEVTLRVLQRFAGGSDGAPHEGSKLGPPRPDGIPTLFDMAYEVIRDAELKGKKGLSVKDIVEAIGKRYWPGVRGQQISAPLYGMAKKGRFNKTSNGLFQTVRKDKAPADLLAGASSNHGGEALSSNPNNAGND